MFVAGAESDVTRKLTWLLAIFAALGVVIWALPPRKIEAQLNKEQYDPPKSGPIICAFKPRC